MNEKTNAAEHSIITKYKKTLFHRFIGAVKDYRLIQKGDKIAVCISGGKDSMLLAKLMQELSRHGDYPFDMDKAYEKIYLRPLSEVRLHGYISLNMKVTPNKLGYIVVTDDVINELGVDSASAGNMVNDFNYIKEILVWATITEDKKNDQYRVSIRSRGPEINKVAENHGGGGHKYASGVKTKSLDAALDVMRDLDKALSLYSEEVI